MEENGAGDARRRSLCTAISLSLTWARGNASRIIDAESEREDGLQEGTVLCTHQWRERGSKTDLRPNLRSHFKYSIKATRTLHRSTEAA